MAFNKDKDNAAASIMDNEIKRDSEDAKSKNSKADIEANQADAETEKPSIPVEQYNPDAVYPKMDDPASPTDMPVKNMEDVFSECKGRTINSIEDLKEIYRKVQELVIS